MSYANVQDMLDAFEEDELVALTDEDSSGVVHTPTLAQALTDADAEIDTYVGAKYRLPLSTTPPVLRRLAKDIARYLLYDDRPTDAVRDRYTDAVSLLKLIAEGKVTLGVDPSRQQAPATGGAPIFVTPTKVFSGGKLKGFTS